MIDVPGFRVRAPSGAHAEAVNGLVAALETGVQGFTASTIDDIRDGGKDAGLANMAWTV